MIRLIVFLVVAAAAALLTTWLANNPGSVQVAWGGQTIQTSFGMLLLAFLVVGLLISLLVEIVRALRVLPARMRRRKHENRRLRGYRALTSGFVAAAAGNVGRARSLLREAEQLLPQEHSVQLLAAQAAQLEGKEDVAHLKFRHMLQAPETQLLGLRGLLAQSAKADDRNESLDLARQAYEASPNTPWAAQTYFDLLTRAGRWAEALPLVPRLHALKQVDETVGRRRRAVLEHLVGQDERAAGHDREALRRARTAVKLAPGFAPGAVAAAAVAKEQNNKRLARKLLEASWRAEPHPDVARAYAQLEEAEAPADRLGRVERQLGKLQPGHPELNLILGELAIAAGRYDEARRDLEAAVAKEPTARAYQLLIEAERAGGAAQPRIDELTAQAQDARPDKVWVCDDSGDVLPGWVPLGTSGRFDVVHWAQPPRIATLVGRDHGPFLGAVGGADGDADGGEPPATGAAQPDPLAHRTIDGTAQAAA